jgi:hypothetical protein
MRFQAPDHVSALVCFAGEFRADAKGLVKVDEKDCSAALRNAFASAGWTVVEDEPAAKPGK